MKRRALSFITTLALCLNLCPTWALAAGNAPDGTLCPHHTAHTDVCGYALPVSGQECTHQHDEDCYTVQTDCVHEHTAECYPVSTDDSEAAEPVLCPHVCTEDSGCVTRTLSCTHKHDEACGYVPGTPGAACTFVCRICPIEELIGALPDSVSDSDSEQVGEQLGEIFDLYDALTAEEQAQVDLSPCAALMDQLEELSAGELSDSSTEKKTLTDDDTRSTPYEVSIPALFDTASFTLTNNSTDSTGPNSTAILVTGTGKLELRGKVVSQRGIGVKVESGGTLTVIGNTSISGDKKYAIYIASGANVKLFAGTYSGQSTAIYAEDTNFDFSSLLAEGCAFFDADGNVLSPDDLATVDTLTVKQCKDHQKTYTHTSGTPTHTWTCDYCGTTGTEKCTFTFNENGEGTCGQEGCGNKLTIVVEEISLPELVYDGTLKPDQITTTVTLADGSGKELTRGSDYKVDFEPRKDAGEVTVTVTGITFNGEFVKTYTVERAEPKIEWSSTTCSVDYDGKEVDNLPGVTITAVAGDDLSSNVRYAYKKTDDADFTDGLPTNAGTYQVKAYLEESDNYKEMETDPLLSLTINPIAPIVTAPEATKPTYNRSPQALVTAGTLNPVAVADGLTIEFATEENGAYSTTIPTATDAGDYNVWYKVIGLTDNYITPNLNPAEITGVEIQRKKITPTITVQEQSYVYDGSKKQPKITVKDGTFVLDENQYTVTWVGTKSQADNDLLRLADTYTATITGKDETNGGNYEFTATTKVEIVPANQNALKITGKPSSVHYGDTITSLDTSGGTADGEVTWSVTAGGTNSIIDASTGRLTVKDTGSITIKAERAVPNYGTVSDTWTFTVEPKPVTAVVTVTSKTYDGNTTANVTATVKDSDLVNGDSVTLTGLIGTYDNANAGTGKTVTLDSTNVTADNTDKYTVSFPATAKGDIINMATKQS